MNPDCYLIIVTPADGWGVPWYELYHDKTNAENRIKALAAKYEMELRHDVEGLKAIRYGYEFDIKHRIVEAVINRMYYED